MDFLNNVGRNRVIGLVKSFIDLNCYHIAIDHMKFLIKSDDPLSFEERETFFSIYLRQKDSLYDRYQRISNANLSDRERLDLREETRLAVYGIINGALELVNSY